MGVEWKDIIDSVRLDQALDALGVRVLQIIRGEHWSSCPLPSHPGSDATPSFSINEDTLLWNCFTCGEGGYLPALVAKLEDTDWDGGVHWLVPFSDGETDTDAGFMKQLERYLEQTTEKPKPRPRTVAMPYFSPNALDGLKPCPVELLEKWNITDETVVQYFGLRYDPERQRKNTDYFGPCIVIPHYFKTKLVGYQERWLDPDRPKKIPKYTNSDDFPKAETLYGWDDALVEMRHSPQPIVVVESAMTVQRLWQLAVASVGTFGAQVTDQQIRLLVTLPHGVILARDEDPDYLNSKGKWVTGAGVKAFASNADRLSAKIPVWSIPSIDKEKGDLADLVDDEVLALLARKKTVFSLLSDA